MKIEYAVKPSALGAFVAAFLSSCAVMVAAVAAAILLWSWFLARQYGPGPTLGEWSGIAAIYDVMILVSRPLEVSDPATPAPAGGISFSRSTLRIVAIAFVAARAFAVGSALEWIS